MYWGKGYPAAFNPLLWNPCQEPLLFFRKLFLFSLVKKLRAKCPINLSKRPLWLLVAELCTFGLAPSHSFFFLQQQRNLADPPNTPKNHRGQLLVPQWLIFTWGRGLSALSLKHSPTVCLARLSYTMFLFLRPVCSVRGSEVKNKPRARFATTPLGSCCEPAIRQGVVRESSLLAELVVGVL